MRPVSKRAFAFRYIIESLGQKIMVVHQTSLLKTFACPTEKIGCFGRSEHQNFQACNISYEVGTFLDWDGDTKVCLF